LILYSSYKAPKKRSLKACSTSLVFCSTLWNFIWIFKSWRFHGDWN